MQLLCCLRFFIAHYDIRIVCKHIAGSKNIAADHLSRNNLLSFFSSCPCFINPLTTATGLADDCSHFMSGLDIRAFHEAVQFHYKHSLASSTRELSTCGIQHYLWFATLSIIHLYPPLNKHYYFSPHILHCSTYLFKHHTDLQYSSI